MVIVGTFRLYRFVAKDLLAVCDCKTENKYARFSENKDARKMEKSQKAFFEKIRMHMNILLKYLNQQPINALVNSKPLPVKI